MKQIQHKDQTYLVARRWPPDPTRGFPERLELVGEDGAIVFARPEDCFHEVELGLDPIAPFVPFSQRTPDFLTKLREERLDALKYSQKARKKVEKSSGTTTKSRKSRKKEDEQANIMAALALRFAQEGGVR